VLGAIEDAPISEARRQFEANLFGLGRLTQAVLPSMRAKRFGRIAEAIREAVAARTPRTRYAVGFGAKPMLILRRCLSDRMFDRLVKRAMA
jgi:NAD(P)-dependent dehydrogenase (short-subunit alcohol dehydrogenase family)